MEKGGQGGGGGAVSRTNCRNIIWLQCVVGDSCAAGTLVCTGVLTGLILGY